MHRILLFIVCALVSLVLLTALSVVLPSAPWVNCDLVTLWSGAYWLRYPSEAAATFSPAYLANARSVVTSYPPWALPTFAWIGLFLVEEVAKIWFFLSVALFSFVSALLYLLLKESERSEALSLFCAIASVALWYPTYNHLGVGQLTAMQLVAFLGALLAYRSSSYFIGGMMLGLSAVKPQSIFLIYALVVVAAITRPQYRRVLLGMIVMILLMSVVGVGIRFHVISGFWPLQLDAVTAVRQPNLASNLRYYFGYAWTVVPPIAALVIAIRYHRRIDPLRIQWGTLLIPLSILCSPYSNIHDMVFLSPVLATILICTPGKSPSLSEYISSMTIAFLFVAPFLQARNDGGTIYGFVWVPVVALLVVSLRRKEIFGQSILSPPNIVPRGLRGFCSIDRG